jgi:hypothetical protein
LFDALKSNQCLRVLSLNGNQLTNECCYALREYLQCGHPKRSSGLHEYIWDGNDDDHIDKEFTGTGDNPYKDRREYDEYTDGGIYV